MIGPDVVEFGHVQRSSVRRSSNVTGSQNADLLTARHVMTVCSWRNSRSVNSHVAKPPSPISLLRIFYSLGYILSTVFISKLFLRIPSRWHVYHPFFTTSADVFPSSLCLSNTAKRQLISGTHRVKPAEAGKKRACLLHQKKSLSFRISLRIHPGDREVLHLAEQA